MSYTVIERDCENCGSSNTSQVINAGDSLRVGWYCTDCRHMTPAKDKERLLNGEDT